MISRFFYLFDIGTLVVVTKSLYSLSSFSFYRFTRHKIKSIHINIVVTFRLFRSVTNFTYKDLSSSPLVPHNQ